METYVHTNDYDIGSNLLRAMRTVQRVSEGMEYEKYSQLFVSKCGTRSVK